jgi:hypothetical protein
MHFFELTFNGVKASQDAKKGKNKLHFLAVDAVVTSQRVVNY